MDYFENHRYWLIRLVLCFVGLWPYADQGSRFIISCVQIISGMAFMFSVSLKFIILLPSIESVIYILGYLMICFTATITYFIFTYKMPQIKDIWEHIERDWKKLEKTNKISIAERYADKSNLLSLYVLILCTMYYVFTCLDVFLPYMLDAIVYLKQPNRHKAIVPVEFFIKYDVALILLSTFMIMLAGVLVAVHISTFIIFVQHACLLFSLVGCPLNVGRPSIKAKETILSMVTFDNLYTHRFFSRHILKSGFKYIEETNTAINKDKVLYETITESVNYHESAIQFAKTLEDTYTVISFYVMITVIAMLSSNTLRLFHMSLSHNLFPAIASFVYLFCSIGIAFIVTHTGQLLIDHSLDVFNKTCAVPWYVASIKTQKLLLIILTRAIKTSYMTNGKMAILAHTLFTMLLHSTISFTTLFISMR